MKRTYPKQALRRGVSLVETMVAIGVLAIVGPLAIAALMKSGEGGAAARAETRSPAMVERCLDEVKSARVGVSEHLPKLQPGVAFGADPVLCLAFSRDGALLGRVGSGDYDAGIRDKIARHDVAYLARVEGTHDSERPGFPPLLSVRVTVEFPAVAPSDKRRRMEFHTKLP